jgi:hypothetical protein
VSSRTGIVPLAIGLSLAAMLGLGAAGAASTSGQSTVANASQAQAAIDRAAKANKYVFLFFWKDKGPQTDKAWRVLQPAIAKLPDSADVVAIQITNPAEKKIVDNYSVTRAPMPLVLAVAPGGAITKAFTKTFNEKELRTAFVSPCTQRCLKALQSRKLVFVCLVDKTHPQDPTRIPKGVEKFKADKKYGDATEIVVLNVRDAKEATFLKELGFGDNATPMVAFLAPPGALIGTFSNSTGKEMYVSKLTAAQSNPCGAGGCGSGGCGPKK